MIKTDEKFIKQRIAKLRTEKDVSARELSFDLGQSAGYINTIENGKSLPSMSMFLYMCEYFGISPSEFFDESAKHPALIEEIAKECRVLDRDSLESILSVVKAMKKNVKSEN